METGIGLLSSECSLISLLYYSTGIDCVCVSDWCVTTVGASGWPRCFSCDSSLIKTSGSSRAGRTALWADSSRTEPSALHFSHMAPPCPLKIYTVHHSQPQWNPNLHHNTILGPTAYWININQNCGLKSKKECDGCFEAVFPNSGLY